MEVTLSTLVLQGMGKKNSLTAESNSSSSRIPPWMRRILIIALGLTLAAGPASAEKIWDKPPRFTPAELRADFTAMYESLRSAAFDLYAFTPRAVLDRASRAALAELNRSMTLFEAQIRFQKFAALARMGHTRVDFPRAVWAQHLKEGGKVFPLAIRVVNDQTMRAEQKRRGRDRAR